jgi:hypothetical protein
MRILISALAAALIAAPAQAQTAPDRQAALERIYPEEFVFIHGTGGIADRTRQIDRLLAMPATASISTPPLDDLHVYGETAVLRIRDDSGPAIATNVFAKKDGRWQVVQVQTTLLPPQRKAVPIDVRVFQEYAGKYEQDDGDRATVTVEGDRLMIDLVRHSKFRLIPASDTEFFLGMNKVTLYRDAAGRVTHYVELLPNGHEVTGRRIL